MPTYADIQGLASFGRMADAQPDRVTMRLLVIEDDRDAADYLVKAFREVGHVADAATDGEDGLAMALDGQYDVLIVDRMLPKRDGLSLIGALRDKGIETPASFFPRSAKSTTGSKACAPAATITCPSPIRSPSCWRGPKSWRAGEAAATKRPCCASPILSLTGCRTRFAAGERFRCNRANSACWNT